MPVLVQKPNAPILVWGSATVLIWIVPQGRLEDLLRLIAFGSLFTWAWLEIFDGVNYIRRVMGVVVMTILLIHRL
jgi:hypothetical protein